MRKVVLRNAARRRDLLQREITVVVSLNDKEGFSSYRHRTSPRRQFDGAILGPWGKVALDRGCASPGQSPPPGVPLTDHRGGGMETTPELTIKELLIARNAIASGREGVDLPNGYLNFELALAILDGCRDAIIMADAHNPNTLIEKLATATRALALLQSGVAAASVQAARARLETTIAALRT